MSIPDSRLRGLIRDLTDGLAQQMYLWGRDVRHPDGNALVRAGLQRIARIDNEGEGTSLYRIERENGWIELHGFCAGWRPHDPEANGMLYIRHRHRLFSCAPGEPIEPGRYAHRVEGKSNDLLLALARPFLAWMLDHERWIHHHHAPAYRAACWRHVATLPGYRPWLEPQAATTWFAHLLKNPDTTPRAALVQTKTVADPNSAKLVGIWDDFRRPLFDVGGGPFLCGVLSSIGSSLGGVF